MRRERATSVGCVDTFDAAASEIASDESAAHTSSSSATMAALSLDDLVGADLDALVAAGHDGIEVYGAGDMATSTFYIAFRPEQIKSAIGNSGAFDPSNPSIIASQRTAPAVRPERPVDRGPR